MIPHFPHLVAFTVDMIGTISWSLFFAIHCVAFEIARRVMPYERVFFFNSQLFFGF
jgi:hypothetical protein